MRQRLRCPPTASWSEAHASAIEKDQGNGSVWFGVPHSVVVFDFSEHVLQDAGRCPAGCAFAVEANEVGHQVKAALRVEVRRAVRIRGGAAACHLSSEVETRSAHLKCSESNAPLGPVRTRDRPKIVGCWTPFGAIPLLGVVRGLV